MPIDEMQHRNEVVIDGDSSSSDGENEVRLVVQPRKRARTSIATTDDEVDADTDEGPHARPNSSAAAKRLEEEESEDEDDVQILQIGSNKSTPSSAKKARRLTILDSDEEEQERADLRKDPVAALRASVGARRPSPRLQTPQPSGVTTRHGSSSSRRSSRIATKQEKKAAQGSGARKLEFLSLENCLEPMAQKPFGNEAVSSDEESESDVASPVRRRQSLQARQESESERVYADPDDIDEFIVADDEVEYMDENEEGVISVQSSSDEEGGGTGDEEAAQAAHAAAMQTREPKEWFSIYLSYLEECILNADLDDLMRRSRVNPQYMMFKEAIRHIERAVCSRRDSLRGNVVWPDEMMHSLWTATEYRTSRCDGTQDCDACNRRQHVATFRAHFRGIECDARDLYRDNWITRLRKGVKAQEVATGNYEMGSVCHARTLAFWQLLHAKHFWVALVDAKMKECGDRSGRIPEEERETFHKQEFGRYKRLLDLVDKFSTDANMKWNSFMPNVWKKVTAHNFSSEFLQVNRSAVDRETRRGTLDSVVGDSTDEDNEQKHEEEEEEEELQLEEEEKKEANEDKIEPAPKRAKGRMWQTKLQLSAPPTKPKADIPDENDSRFGEDNLRCLVCEENPRNGIIVHGQYVHTYCCYRCAKRQFQSKLDCTVCHRPIERVLCQLPLSKESRLAILREKNST